MKELPKIKFSCPHCGQSIEGPGEVVGTTVACTICDGQMQVPAVLSKFEESKHKRSKPRKIIIWIAVVSVVVVALPILFIGLLHAIAIYINVFGSDEDKKQFIAGYEQSVARERGKRPTGQLVQQYFLAHKAFNHSIEAGVPKFQCLDEYVLSLKSIRYADCPLEVQSAWTELIGAVTEFRASLDGNVERGLQNAGIKALVGTIQGRTEDEIGQRLLLDMLGVALGENPERDLAVDKFRSAESKFMAIAGRY